MRKYELLSEKELNSVHEASLDVMENLGVKFTVQKALDIFSDAGFLVDKQGVVK